jgi:hypothetical protein
MTGCCPEARCRRHYPISLYKADFSDLRWQALASVGRSRTRCGLSTDRRVIRAHEKTATGHPPKRGPVAVWRLAGYIFAGGGTGATGSPGLT